MDISLIVVIAIVAIIVIFLWSTYNGLVTLNVRVDEAWSDITVQLKRRADLIPNLIETVKGYATHESSVFENVTRARAATISPETMGNPAKAAKAGTDVEKVPAASGTTTSAGDAPEATEPVAMITVEAHDAKIADIQAGVDAWQADQNSKLEAAATQIADLEKSFADAQARVIELEGLLETDPKVVYHVMRAIVRVVHEIQRRLSMQTAELTNYLYKTHGRY